ncbi:MAG: hypothetical protein IKK74_08980 [Clostridia bacterium]|nr:hypothetical protein [Clostridia bacterium]
MSIYTSVSMASAVVAVTLIAFLALIGKIDYKSGGLWNSLQICVLINAMMSMLGEMLTMLGFAQLYWIIVAIGALLIVVKIVSAIKMTRSVASYRNSIDSAICFESFYGVGKIDIQKLYHANVLVAQDGVYIIARQSLPKDEMMQFLSKDEVLLRRKVLDKDKLNFYALNSHFNTGELFGVYDRQSGAELFEIGTRDFWRKTGKKDEFIRELKKIGMFTE